MNHGKLVPTVFGRRSWVPAAVLPNEQESLRIWAVLGFEDARSGASFVGSAKEGWFRWKRIEEPP